jgi:hypothetical protein
MMLINKNILFHSQNQKIKVGIVVHVYNPSTREREAGGSQVLKSPRLHCKTLPQTKQNKTKQPKKLKIKLKEKKN